MGRKSTFNASETNKLFEICGRYSSIIECKKTDCISTKEKDATWEKIAKELKKIKYATKAKAAEERRGIYSTGGGPATSGVEERMLSMLNDKEMEGVANTCDSDTVLAAVHLVENSSPEAILEAPLHGPATLRKKISAPLWTPRKLCNKSTKITSWENLASVKSKWTEAKLEVDLAKKEEERVDLQMKLMLERRELDFLQQKERQEIEMEILSVRLQREKLELKKLYNA